LLGAAYYVFRAGVAVRRARGLAVYPERLRPNRHARRFAGVQMAVVAASLFPVVPSWLTAPAATAAMLPTLALFAREWLIVTGRLAPPDAGEAPPGIAAR
jgi:CDP-diacylglycerol--glycerol-3-phosphate 3-phosphatidyltransferase